ncbi:hypothetical protein I6J71_12400 [Amycolatopsis sp. FDAARGOS 1241]|nr:hypothetical protein I6J71_12400 [Amycolatopsis sp. FDAARGOS 1241]
MLRRDTGVADDDLDVGDRDPEVLGDQQRRRGAQALAHLVPVEVTRTVPSARAVRCATAGLTLPGEAPAETPQPTMLPSSAIIEPGCGSRPSQPNCSAPRRRHSPRNRVENGRPVIGSFAVSLASRRSTGSRSSAYASSSIADSTANAAAPSNGARTYPGVWTSLRIRRARPPNVSNP